MRSAISLVLFTCALCCAPREEFKRDFQRSLTLPSGRSFRIEHSLGNLNIRTHGGADLRIQATIRCSANTVTEARECTDRVQISVDESPSGVSVRTIYPRNEGRRNLSYGADFDVLMPAKAPLDARNRFGSVTVTSLEASATINSANGRVIFTGGKGRQRIENTFGAVEVRSNDGEVTIRNGNGDVTASDVTGPLDITNKFATTRVTNAGRGLIIHSNNSNIDVTNVTGVSTITNTFGRVIVTDAKGDLTVDNQNGAVQATGVTGMATLHTSFDRVTASRIGKTLTVRAQNANVMADTIGEAANVETSFGTVDLRGVKGGTRVTASNTSVRLSGVGGEVFAKSSFNGVTVSDAAGPITVVNENGAVIAEMRAGQKCQPVALSTTFSPIRVTLPASGYNVTARTSFGRIHSEHDLTLSGDISPTILTGKIGGGGCELKLTGQNGNIDILKAK